ncbi:MAG: PAS domain S-box protein [Methanobacterium sp. ERen5]|nr:MAG: PAS domain S-box protein [Methanobacterium sp. ERen5]
MLELTILMVEPDAAEAKDIKLSLESLGYKISEIVATGEDAINAVYRTNPDLILMDVDLKVPLDGVETAKMIDRSLNIPIIYLTENLEQIKSEMDNLTGQYTCLIKPITTIELDHCIEYVVFKYARETGLINDLANFKNIFDKTPLGIFHSTVDGKLLRVNTEYAKIFGYSSTEEIITDVNKSTVQDRLYIEPEIRKELIEEVVNDEEWHTYKNQYYHRDGNIIDVELTFRAIKNHNNKVLYLEGFINDISEKRKQKLF